MLAVVVLMGATTAYLTYLGDLGIGLFFFYVTMATYGITLGVASLSIDSGLLTSTMDDQGLRPPPSRVFQMFFCYPSLVPVEHIAQVQRTLDLLTLEPRTRLTLSSGKWVDVGRALIEGFEEHSAFVAHGGVLRNESCASQDDGYFEPRWIIMVALGLVISLLTLGPLMFAI
jgi:hypothetical protein